MKNTKFITLIAGAVLTLTQAGYAVPDTLEEWHEFHKHQASKAAQAQPEAQPANTPACVTLNKQELSDAIKAAVAEALAKMAQKPVQAQQEPEEQPRMEARHKITRKSPETVIELQQQTDDYYDVTLQEGDTLILDLKTNSEMSWQADMVSMNPELLLYAKKESIAPTEKGNRPWNYGPWTTRMYFQALKTGTQWLTFRYSYGIKNQNLLAEQSFKIDIVEKPKTIVPTPVTPAPAVHARPTLALNRTVELRKTFIIEKEEDTPSGETYSFDPAYSDTDRFQLIEEFYATENPGVKKSHYFVFKALKEGSGDLVFMGKKNQPETMWITTHTITVEESKVAPKPVPDCTRHLSCKRIIQNYIKGL